MLDERMKNRRLVRISRIEKTMKNGDIEGDWVTVGVLVDKMPQKTTSTGKNFSGLFNLFVYIFYKQIYISTSFITILSLMLI